MKIKNTLWDLDSAKPVSTFVLSAFAFQSSLIKVFRRQKKEKGNIMIIETVVKSSTSRDIKTGANVCMYFILNFWFCNSILFQLLIYNSLESIWNVLISILASFRYVPMSYVIAMELEKYCSNSKLWLHLESSNCQILVTLVTR